MQSARMLRPRPAAADRSSKVAREIVETVVLTLLIFFAVRFSVQPYRVFGPSMQPGLHTGEFVLVNQLAYRFGSAPQRGDVIVFHPPSDPNGEPYIKRVIAVPGDTVTVTLTEVKVDVVVLQEPYTYPLAPGELSSGTILTDVKLGPGQYFVLGDHRDNSNDSRAFGPVPSQNIIGRAEFVFLPVNNIHMIDTYHNVFKNVRP